MTTDYAGSGDLTRSLELLWKTKEPPTRGPRPGLDLEQVVAAAVRIADLEGLAALSMRRVAAELGVGTMSLYRYVPGKGELLDLMVDHVLGPSEELEPHRGKDWRTLLTYVARGSWELYTGHPWLLQINQSRPLLGPNAIGGFDFALSALDGLGLSGRQKVSVLVALDGYVLGVARTYLLQRQVIEQSGVSDEEFWKAQEPFLVRAMESGDYPQVAALDEDSFNASEEYTFDLGLRVLLDGVAALIARGPAD
ncbi:TetR/AcrR family transcriptional regulator [Streptomyces alkaliterrae]|nr:TetR/AcrR family transcriptional regulator [Streptomyces alkaliterrae]